MRFSICCTSISPSTRPTSMLQARRPTSSGLETCCLSARRTDRCAAMVSASRDGILDAGQGGHETSGGILRDSLTSCSNSDTSERDSTSTSRSVRRIGRLQLTCAVASKQSALGRTRRFRPARLPSTSTLIVPSGSLSSCRIAGQRADRVQVVGLGSSISGSLRHQQNLACHPPSPYPAHCTDFSRPTNSGMTMCG